MCIRDRGDRRTPEVVGGAVRDVVEVASVVDRARDDPLALGRMQEEELDLGVGVEGEALVGGLAPVSYTHLDVYKRQSDISPSPPLSSRRGTPLSG